MSEEYGPPGLREKVIAIICDEWPVEESLEGTAIYERLVSEGIETSREAVRLTLQHLSEPDHEYIMLLASPSRSEPRDELGPISIHLLRQELCEE